MSGATLKVEEDMKPNIIAEHINSKVNGQDGIEAEQTPDELGMEDGDESMRCYTNLVPGWCHTV
ncbi:hypothetical protein L195_g020712 [Trifolium pratense]|uniref:Uncharacterized protein n=1 Tax=Trifolium pratense TaxID=57577 RepID=A0A2K3N359_TRIPR|nr:hypothetical protein L195_g020712 [Trifolium pratense]